MDSRSWNENPYGKLDDGPVVIVDPQIVNREIGHGPCAMANNRHANNADVWRAYKTTILECVTKKKVSLVKLVIIGAVGAISQNRAARCETQEFLIANISHTEWRSDELIVKCATRCSPQRIMVITVHLFDLEIWWISPT